MNRRQIVCFVLVLSLFFTTGCWDRTELNDLALELAWGIDKAQNGAVEVSAQVIIPSKVSGRQGGGGGSQGKSFLVETGIGKDSFDAVQSMQTKLSRQVFRGHRRVILIGEPLARQGIKDVLDTYTRDPDIRLRTDIFVVKGGTAKDFLKRPYPLENIPALATFKEYNQVGSLKEEAFLNFLISATSEGSSPTMPAVAIGSDSSSQDDAEEEEQSSAKGLRIVGTAIFDKNLKLLGFLNMDEGRALRWVTGNLTEQTITAAVPQEKGNVSLILINMGSKIQPVLHGNHIKLNVSLTGKGGVRENNTNLDLAQSKNLTLVQNALDKQVEKSVIKTITKVQKEYGTDVFEFSGAIHRKYPYQWKSLKTDWDKNFSEAEISVKVNLIVRRVGLTGPPLQLKESEIKK